jgi:hypothetical protein
VGCDLELRARTVSATVISTSLEVVDHAVQTVLSRIAPGRFTRLVSELCLTAIYELDPPAGSAHLFKLVIYAPKQSPSSCVLITNLADGWNSLSYNIAKEHKRFQMQVISTKPDAEYPRNSFEVWRSGVSVRKVISMLDSDAWVFFQKGTPEDFEDLGYYERPQKKHRLDRDIIDIYLAKNGWHVSDLSFWEASGEAIYFEELRKNNY